MRYEVSVKLIVISAAPDNIMVTRISPSPSPEERPEVPNETSGFFPMLVKSIFEVRVVKAGVSGSSCLTLARSECRRHHGFVTCDCTYCQLKYS